MKKTHIFIAIFALLVLIFLASGYVYVESITPPEFKGNAGLTTTLNMGPN